MGLLSSQEREAIETCVSESRYDDAISHINELLTKDPSNDELLLMIADIQYKSGEIEKATKAVDFLNASKDNKDPMGLYVKGVLEMEKNKWKEARSFLLQAMNYLERDNAEVMRCYALSEYRYGNREKGIYHLERAHDLSPYDAEIILNILEIYLLERRFHKAEELIAFFHSHKQDLELYDKSFEDYQSKLAIFSGYIDTYYYKKRRTQHASDVGSSLQA